MLSSSSLRLAARLGLPVLGCVLLLAEQSVPEPICKQTGLRGHLHHRLQQRQPTASRRGSS